MIGLRYARIRVIDSKVASASPVEGEHYLLPNIDKAVTVDGVFKLVRTDQERADAVKVTYDETWGFPAQVSVDAIKGAIDDEYGYSVGPVHRPLRPPPRPQAHPRHRRGHVPLSECRQGADASGDVHENRRDRSG
jgi:hypothetical protein